VHSIAHWVTQAVAGSNGRGAHRPTSSRTRRYCSPTSSWAAPAAVPLAKSTARPSLPPMPAAFCTQGNLLQQYPCVERLQVQGGKRAGRWWSSGSGSGGGGMVRWVPRHHGRCTAHICRGSHFEGDRQSLPACDTLPAVRDSQPPRNRAAAPPRTATGGGYCGKTDRMLHAPEAGPCTVATPPCCVLRWQEDKETNGRPQKLPLLPARGVQAR
jgi:hypothetical protein